MCLFPAFIGPSMSRWKLTMAWQCPLFGSVFSVVQCRAVYVTRHYSLHDLHYLSQTVFSCAQQVAAFVTAPFDVVKTHKQIEFGEKVLYADKPVQSLPKVGTITVLKKILRQNGVSGLFAGVIPRVIKVAPACAIMLTSFEYGKSFFFRHNVEAHYNKNGSISWADDAIR